MNKYKDNITLYEYYFTGKDIRIMTHKNCRYKPNGSDIFVSGEFYTLPDDDDNYVLCENVNNFDNLLPTIWSTTNDKNTFEKIKISLKKYISKRIVWECTKHSGEILKYQNWNSALMELSKIGG